MTRVLIAESDVNPEEYKDYLSHDTTLSLRQLPSMAESAKKAQQTIEENLARIEDSDLIVFTGGRDLSPNFYNCGLSSEEMKLYNLSLIHI